MKKQTWVRGILDAKTHRELQMLKIETGNKIQDIAMECIALGVKEYKKKYRAQLHATI